MKAASEKYLEILNNISDVSILVVGDIMLDHYIWGKAERISDESPVPIVWVNMEEDRLGGAANDVRNLKGLGVKKISMVGVIGDDFEANRIEEIVKSNELDQVLLIRDSSRPTTVKTRVIARNQQVVRIDRESHEKLSPVIEDRLLSFLDQEIENYDAIILSDYGKGIFSEKFTEQILIWRRQNKVSLESRPLVLDPHPKNTHLYKYASVIKPNRAEAEKSTGVKINSIADAFTVAEIIQKQWTAELVLLSLSEDGMVLSGGALENPLHIPTIAKEVADVSGAGDTVTSVFTAALAAKATIAEAGFLANLAAGIVIAEVGTAAITRDKLLQALQI